MKTFLENHVDALLETQDQLNQLTQSLEQAERVQTEFKDGSHVVVIPAQFGQYPVFDGMIETGQKVHIAMAYADAQKPGRHFEQHRMPTGTAFQVAREDTSPDQAIHVRFIFPEPTEKRLAGLTSAPQVIFEQPLYTRAGSHSSEATFHPVASDFAIFLKASSYERLLALGVTPSIASVSQVMNTDFHSGAKLVFHMPRGGANMPEVQRAKYASDLIKLFFEAKGYSPEPVDVTARIQAWHSDQEARLSTMRANFETTSAERQELNGQSFTSRELEYLSKLIQALRHIADEYSGLKKTLGPTMVLDSVAKIAKAILKKEPSKRFSTLAAIAYGMRQALESDNEAAFIQKLQAVVTLLSNLERTIQGEDSPSSSDWTWAARRISDPCE